MRVGDSSQRCEEIVKKKKKSQIAPLNAIMIIVICQCLLLDQFVERSARKSVFLLYHLQRDVHLICKLGMTFT